MSRVRIRPLRGWTLRTKLVTAMICLLTVVSVVVGGLTLLSLNQELIRQVDVELDRTIPPVMRDAGQGRPPTDAAEGPLPPDTLIAYVVDGRITSAVISQLQDSPKALTVSQQQALAALELEPNGRAGRTNETIGDLGRYRLTALTIREGEQLVIGRSLLRVDETMVRLSVSVTMLGLAGLIAAGLVGTWIVRHSLQPLRRVARTAGRVAELPLDRGEVALAERVPAPDTDPRTEVGQVGNALNQMLDHIDAALAARQASETRVRQFVADASHELRTPLAAIRGYSEMTRRGGQAVPEDVAHAMRRVESETERMTTLVDDLLLLARLDSGRPLEREPVDLSLLIVDAVSDAHVAGPDHQWTLELPEVPVEVPGDPQRLHQVLANLLANARTHTPPGTKVTVGLTPANEGKVSLTVVDNGPGIPESLLPDIFERFARGDSSRSRAAGSTGLGLAIVAAVVQAHHGTVSVDSEPGRTVFTVTLPAAA